MPTVKVQPMQPTKTGTSAQSFATITRNAPAHAPARRPTAVIVARVEVQRIADALTAELTAGVNSEQPDARITRLDTVATLARDLIRKAHREQMELRRELINAEFCRSLKDRR